MFKSTSTSLILYGILAIIVGIIAIAWPGVTILALVILFAIYAFIGAGDVIHGPRRASTGAYDPWLEVLRSVNPFGDVTGNGQGTRWLHQPENFVVVKGQGFV
jgi:Short repeat of unknown function (DUF308)